jgi:signal transduction histidine kinase
MLRPQDAIRFRYKMEGLDKTWNDAGKRHSADYTNIPAGRYLFRVAAYDLSRPGVFSEISMPIVKGPYFYRTWWFLTLCLASVVALVFAVHRSRVRRLQRQFKAVLAERSRLAREVHDTLLQGCAGISAILEAISSFGEEENSLRAPLLDSARQQLRSTINEAREAIWKVRHEQETPQDFVALLNNMSMRLSGELGIPIQCDVEGQPFHVNRDLAHELTMVVREAIHNAASHADPTLVKLSLQFEKKFLILAVSDNGCGFEPAAAAPDRLHFGLTGMRERVSRLGGTFQLNSRRTAGTTINICVPCAVNRLEEEAV